MMRNVQCLTCDVLFGEPEKKRTPGRPWLDKGEKIMFKRILKKHGVRV
jgi:hypothetical protein